MDTLELTQIVTAHQQAIARHEQWQAESEVRLARIEAIMEANAIQQQQNQEAIASLAAQQHLSQEGGAELKASILELRNLVADYIQARLEQ